MNAESNDIRQRLATELASFDDQLGRSGDDVEMLSSVQDGIARLLEASGGKESGIRRVLREQYESGALRRETFQLVESILDRFVTEQIPTTPVGMREPVVEDDVYSSTTVIDQSDLRDATPSERVQVGSVLRDRFLLQKRISGGSMGVVYKALDRRLAEAGEADQWVAIKVLSPQLARNGLALRALQQEAAKGRNLSHPNIVRFIDFDRDDDLYFIVMEWLEGRSLAEILDTPGTKKLDIDEALEIVRQVGSALEHAHRCGIVHADVKPGNVMILRDGTAKLFDFGVARVWQKADAANDDVDPTGIGAMTPAYSSMQVITGEIPTPADDVFSLACLLYRLVAGYRVFGPRNAAEACEEGMQPQALPGLSKPQWEAVRKALAYSRIARFDSTSAFLDALNARAIEKIAAEPRGNVHSEERWDIGRWAIGIAAVAIIAGFAAYELGHLDRWLPRAGTSVPPVEDAPASADAPPISDDAAPVSDDAPPVSDDVSPAPDEDGIVELPPEPAPSPVATFEERTEPTLPETVSGAPEETMPAPASDAATAAEAAGQRDVADAAPAPAPVETLSPADIEVPLDRSGPERAIVVTLREDGGAVSIDLVRVGRLDTSLALRFEEVDYSGNRSPLRTGQYRFDTGSVVRFAPGDPRARVELSMAPDTLREADQSSLLKVRALEGDSSGLAYIDLSLEDDDQRRFEENLAADTVGFAVSQMSVGEQDPAVQIDVVRYNPGDQPLTIGFRVDDITANDGEDYFAPGGNVIAFAPGQRSARLLVPLVQDSVYEGDESFVVTIDGPAEGVADGVYPRIAVMIRDDDQPPPSPAPAD